MAEDGKKRRQTSFTLSDALIAALDRLKPIYGVRSRGAVVEHLLEYLLSEEQDDASPSTAEAQELDQSPRPSEASSLVLIQKDVLSTSLASDVKDMSTTVGSAPEPSGIELPGFVRRRSQRLKQTLASPEDLSGSPESDPMVSAVSLHDLTLAQTAADDHWRSLYGQPPGNTVVEAAITWLARDLWPSLDASDGRLFTWTGANASVQQLCPTWTVEPPTLGRVMAVAGTLEDPFATGSLAERMPTMIRRFVNRFRRSNKVTSFETLESTMTVHGALKLLGLSTQPGAEVTLQSIKEAYKTSAKNAHPDTGGSQESMRRVSEAYQLLSGVYRRQ